jgi:hypothetical protein
VWEQKVLGIASPFSGLEFGTLVFGCSGMVGTKYQSSFGGSNNTASF